MPESKTDPNVAVLDNRLALSQFIMRCEASGTDWALYSDFGRTLTENRYELRVFTGEARAIYRGATATHAASKAMAAFDEHRIGWEST